MLKNFNCHCEDCRKCSGAPYLTDIFVKEEIHQLESGNRITKNFREKCVYRMFSYNKGRPGLVRFHSGKVNELEVIKPRETYEYQKRYLQ